MRAGGCLPVAAYWQSTGCTSQVFWVRFPVTAGLFSIFASKYLNSLYSNMRQEFSTPCHFVRGTMHHYPQQWLGSTCIPWNHKRRSELCNTTLKLLTVQKYLLIALYIFAYTRLVHYYHTCSSIVTEHRNRICYVRDCYSACATSVH